mmetsp:Transcript_25578/g.73033  ORF Transcript_25578/g.73033 Transcript_25578/m.73033 type:complete len:757 (-) Transcript_25578:46-2316(-)
MHTPTSMASSFTSIFQDRFNNAESEEALMLQNVPDEHFSQAGSSASHGRRGAPFNNQHSTGQSRESSSGSSVRDVWERWDWSDVGKFEFQDQFDDEDEPLRPRLGPSMRDISVGSQALHTLDFLDQDWFLGLMSSVILLNSCLVTYEATNGDAEQACRPLFVAALMFYALELGCRVLRSGVNIFSFDRLGFVNWAFLFVVLEGGFRLVLVPLCVPALKKSAFVNNMAQISVMLTCTRLVVIMRVVILTWTETHWFQWMSGGVIMANSIVMGIELDSPSPLWWWVNQAMLMFFLFETSARIRLRGCASFLCDPNDRVWNIMDFLIVAFGVLDSWTDRIAQLLGGVSGHRDNGPSNLMMMLVRMLRLLRILRLLKLVKAVRPLYILAKGVTQAMQSIFWVLVLTLVTIYAFAILATRMVGHGLLLHDPNQIPKETKEMFATICDSMFTLFGVMNSQLFSELEPLMSEVPCTKPAFVVFTICSSWALLSVMTGVVSDHMMSVRETQAQNDEQAQEDRRAWLNQNLCGIFAAADKDGSGTLGRDEYLELLKSPYHREKIQEITTMPVQDLAMMFEWLDFNGNGVIDFKELFRGCAWLNEPINGKSFLKITHSARSHCCELRKMTNKLRNEAELLKRRHENWQERLADHLHEALEAKRRFHEADRRAADAAQARLAAREELYTACTVAGYEATSNAAVALGHQNEEELLAFLRSGPTSPTWPTSPTSGDGAPTMFPASSVGRPDGSVLATTRLLTAPNWAR